MIPAPFTYQRAGSADEALELAADGGEDAKFLAGGHSLLPLMKLRLAVPEILIDIGRLSELRYIRDGWATLRSGTAGRSAARWRTPTPRPTCPPWSWPWTAS